jgi:hypothetical protein
MAALAGSGYHPAAAQRRRVAVSEGATCEFRKFRVRKCLEDGSSKGFWQSTIVALCLFEREVDVDVLDLTRAMPPMLKERAQGVFALVALVKPVGAKDDGFMRELALVPHVAVLVEQNAPDRRNRFGLIHISMADSRIAGRDVFDLCFRDGRKQVIQHRPIHRAARESWHDRVVREIRG